MAEVTQLHKESTTERLLRISNAFRIVLRELDEIGDNDALLRVRAMARSGLERVEGLLDLIER